MSETMRMINALSDAEVLHRKHMKQLRANHQSEIARLTKANAELREALNALLARFEDGCGTCHLSPEEWDHLKFGIPAIANSSEGE